MNLIKQLSLILIFSRDAKKLYCKIKKLKKNNTERKNLSRITPLVSSTYSRNIANVLNFSKAEESGYVIGQNFPIAIVFSMIGKE
jgi:hypothetical protein